MREICVMGDSQAAAIRQGWSRIEHDFPGVALTFFAGANADWKSVHVSNGKLVPGTDHLRAQFARSSRGPAEIGGDFDAYILCGLGLALSHPLRLWTHHERTTWEAHRAVVADYVRDSECAHVLPRLREIASGPILVLGGPHQPAEFCKSSALLDDATALRLAENFDAECEALARERAAVFVPQPVETLAPNRVTTRMEFALSAEDRRHCNARYGAIALANALRSGAIAN